MKGTVKINIYNDSKEIFYGEGGVPCGASIPVERVIELMLPPERRSITEVSRILEVLKKEI